MARSGIGDKAMKMKITICANKPPKNGIPTSSTSVVLMDFDDECALFPCLYEDQQLMKGQKHRPTRISSFAFSDLMLSNVACVKSSGKV